MLQALIVVFFFLFVELKTGTDAEARSLLLLWNWISKSIDQLYSMICKMNSNKYLDILAEIDFSMVKKRAGTHGLLSQSRE